MISVVLEDPLCPRADPISHNNLHASLPVDRVILLLEFKENFVEDLLPHFRQLLKQLGFKVDGPHSQTLPESMKNIVEFHRRLYPPIDCS